MDWRTLHPHFLNCHYTALSFFTDEEFCYFLPVYLIAEIWESDQFDNDREDIESTGSNCDPVFHLAFDLIDPSSLSQELTDAFYRLNETGAWPDDVALKSELSEKWDAIHYPLYQIKRFSGFTWEQHKAIIAYLQYRAVDDDYSREQIHHAIENYWSKTV